MPEDNYYFDRLYKRRKNLKFLIDREIISLVKKYAKPKSKILDLGVGDSGNFIELAKEGYNISVLDISKRIIEEINKICKKEKIKVNAILQDIRYFKFRENYDVILCNGLLHFLTRKEGYSLLNNLKKYTNKDGINIITAFKEGDKSQSEKDSFYVKKDELKNVYKNWSILNYEDKKYLFIVVKKEK